MKVLPFLIGFPMYAIVNFVVFGTFGFAIGFFNAKVFRHSGGFNSGLLLGSINAALFMLIMIFVFSWFGYDMPLFFAILFGVLITSNNIYRVRTRPNKMKELGGLVGEIGTIIGLFINVDYFAV